MPPAKADPLLAQLVVIARLLGADQIALRGACGVRPAVLRSLVAAGARRIRHVIHHDGNPPFVLERAELAISGLVIEASAPPRPASPGERAALDSDAAFYCLDSCRVVEMTNVD